MRGILCLLLVALLACRPWDMQREFRLMYNDERKA